MTIFLAVKDNDGAEDFAKALVTILPQKVRSHLCMAWSCG
jgi:hypothetical protein